MPDHPRIDDLRRRVQKDPASIAFAQLAEEYRRAGQYAEAVETCRAGLAIHPGYLSARVTLGRALIELDDLDAAQAELDRVLGGAPENLSAVRGLAEIHHRRGDVAAALAQYQTASSLAPNDPDLEQLVADLKRQVESSVRSAAQVPLPPPPEGPSDPPVDAERDRAERTVSALEEFLAAIHAAGANRRS
jgi:tetratricopeptide (TPR) repeat protein